MSTGVLFISSVQKELQQERFAVRDYVSADPLMRKFFEPFLFEDLPAVDRKPDKAYFDEVDRCRVYLGIFGNEYGWENSKGLSATELEFDRATEKGKYRILLVKGSDEGKRHPRMRSLIRKAESQLVRRRFNEVPELIQKLYASLVEYLAITGALHTLPFDASPSIGAGLKDLSGDKVKWFVRQARQERNFPLSASATVTEVMEHLNLLEKNTPKNAAMLLFGKNPQRFVSVAEIKCLHFHGTEIEKPIPSYQLFKGTVFDQVDEAVDFVLSKLNRRVNPSGQSPASDVEYEIPYKAVREAIVNAVAHRDYTSNAGVQVHVFADRLEVRNPGSLPPGWTPERLTKPHTSVPGNPLLAEPLYLARYIEKAGTGTLDMITLCRMAGLPDPDFVEDGNEFVLTIWRVWLTAGALDELHLTDRQEKAVRFVMMNKRITNTDYQRELHVSKPTASRDLDELVKKGVFGKVGATGKGTYYELKRKGLRKGSKGSARRNGSQRAQRAHGGKGSSATKRIKGDKKGAKGT